MPSDSETNAAQAQVTNAEPAGKAGRIKIRAPGATDEYPAVGPGNEPAATLSADTAAQAGEARIPMLFPKAVVLTDDQHKRIRFPMGLVNVPAHLADHWYLAANGVTRADAQDIQNPS